MYLRIDRIGIRVQGCLTGSDYRTASCSRPAPVCVLIVLAVLKAVEHAEHLSIEFYTVVMLLTFTLIIISIPITPHSFIPGLKPSFSALPTVAFPFFFMTDSMDFPDCLPIHL